jgi:hypothetical protein
VEHSTRGVDLAAIDMGDLIRDSDLIEYWKPERIFPSHARVDLGAEMLVIGYPMEFYDTKQNLPIIRSGTLATTYGAMFRGQPVFLIDANLHPGTSGSPVVVPRSTSHVKEIDILKSNEDESYGGNLRFVARVYFLL